MCITSHIREEAKLNPAARGSFDDKRSVIQVAELKYVMVKLFATGMNRLVLN